MEVHLQIGCPSKNMPRKLTEVIHFPTSSKKKPSKAKEYYGEMKRQTSPTDPNKQMSLVEINEFVSVKSLDLGIRARNIKRNSRNEQRKRTTT